MSTDNQSAQSREAFEDAVFNAYFFKSIKRNPNPPRGTGAMDFIATATKTQAELCERDGESYKDEAVSAMWFGWGLAARALAQAPAPSGEAMVSKKMMCKTLNILLEHEAMPPESLQLLRDILSPAEPDGWVLVPKEPTVEMLRAGVTNNERPGKPYAAYTASEVNEIYRDMIAAAPKGASK